MIKRTLSTALVLLCTSCTSPKNIETAVVEEPIAIKKSASYEEVPWVNSPGRPNRHFQDIEAYHKNMKKLVEASISRLGAIEDKTPSQERTYQNMLKLNYRIKIQASVE